MASTTPSEEWVEGGGEGNCYDSAVETVQEMHRRLAAYPQAQATLFLCHGNVVGTGGAVKGKRFTHAWTEYGDLVLDNSNGHQWSGRREAYYRLGKVRDVKRYSYGEMLRNLLRHRHYGPWE